MILAKKNFLIDFSKIHSQLPTHQLQHLSLPPLSFSHSHHPPVPLTPLRPPFLAPPSSSFSLLYFLPLLLSSPSSFILFPTHQSPSPLPNPLTLTLYPLLLSFLPAFVPPLLLFSHPCSSSSYPTSPHLAADLLWDVGKGIGKAAVGLGRMREEEGEGWREREERGEKR